MAQATTSRLMSMIGRREPEVTRRSALAFALLGLGSARSEAQTPSDITDTVLRQKSDGGPLVWSEAQLGQLLTAFERSGRHGLNAKPFTDAIRAATEPESRRQVATEGALSLADALAHGLVDPSKVNDVYTLATNRVDVRSELSAALESGDLVGWFDSLAPSNAEYRALSDAYVRYRSEIASSPAANVANGQLLRLGDRDQRLQTIRSALVRKGYLRQEVQLDRPQIYTGEVADAVRALQEEEGLTVDGVVGPDTIWALNSGPADRARQIAINLERWRWLARNPSPTRIDVNTAAAWLVYTRDGVVADARRTVVGRPDWATPSLGASFDQLVINPPWYVPQSIARREILPRGPAYRAKRNMYVSRGRVIQRPGPNAALGLVKFDMRNRYAIYLHDTPSKAAFSQSDRHRSHGCIRVQDAVGFARLLATERGKRAEFDRHLAGGKTARLRFDAPIEVRLLYHTAFLKDGRVAFSPDPYGRDARLAQALGMPERKRLSRAAFRRSCSDPDPGLSKGKRLARLNNGRSSSRLTSSKIGIRRRSPRRQMRNTNILFAQELARCTQALRLASLFDPAGSGRLK